jgi:hypothetical protein
MAATLKRDLLLESEWCYNYPNHKNHEMLVTTTCYLAYNSLTEGHEKHIPVKQGIERKERR